MSSYIRNIVDSLKLFLIASNNMKLQKKFIAQHLTPVIEAAKTTNDGSLDDEDFKKIHLYALTVPAMLGEAFCVLRDAKMNERERKAITFLSSITGLFDDFFDRRNLSESYVKNLLDNPNKSSASNKNELLFIKLYTIALENSNKQDLIKSNALKVYYAQLASKKQSEGNLTHDEIEQITFEKGGVSIPLYRCAFEGEINPSEYEMLYYLGAIGQLENDIFDVYKDYIANIQTLATIETDIKNLSSTYKSLMNKISTLISQTSYLTTNKQKFVQFVNLVTCRGLVGLDMLERNANRTQGIFQPAKYKRKDLICDMESPYQLLKLLHYAALCHKK